MVAPVIRRFEVTFTEGTDPLDTIKVMQDTTTELNQLTMLKPNQILDGLNSPEPANLEIEIQVFKGSSDTGLRFFTSDMDPASAGRIAIGPIDTLPGQFQFKAKVLSFGSLSSAAETYFLALKFITRPN